MNMKQRVTQDVYCQNQCKEKILYKVLQQIYTFISQCFSSYEINTVSTREQILNWFFIGE
jgi:hypothetical protein